MWIYPIFASRIVRFFINILHYTCSELRCTLGAYMQVWQKIKDRSFTRHYTCIYTYMYICISYIVVRQRARSRDQSIVRSCKRASERTSERLRNLHLRYKSRNLDNDLCATVTTASHVRSQGIRAAWRETHACTHLGVHMHMTRICVRKYAAIGKLCVNGAHAGASERASVV